MKSSKTILIIAICMFISIMASAQYNNGFKNYKGEFIKQFKFGLGYGFTETDQTPLYILDGFGGWAGPGKMPLALIPKTFNIEKRWDPHFRINLGLSFTRYIPRTVAKFDYQTTKTKDGEVTVVNDTTVIIEDGTTKTKNKTDRIVSYGGRSTYIGLDVNFLYNFRAFKHRALLRKTWTLGNLHKEKYYFDGYFLGGLGLYNQVAIPTFNTGVGGDYWFSYQWGINVQTMAKWSLNANNRFHMHHQFGVVYRFDQGNDAGALGALRRRQARKRKKVKPVLKEKKETFDEDNDFE